MGGRHGLLCDGGGTLRQVVLRDQRRGSDRAGGCVYPRMSAQPGGIDLRDEQVAGEDSLSGENGKEGDRVVTDSKDRKENGEASEKKPAEQNQPVEKAEAAPAE